MARDKRTCRPDCGSHQAVAKWAARDAAAEIPPMATEELDRLHKVEMAARTLIAASPHPGNEKSS